ncbi:hypothetical protein Ancab_022465 [Ancistrocladus abbreviatus]
MPEGSGTHMGMRLGSRRTLFQFPNCITSKLWNEQVAGWPFFPNALMTKRGTERISRAVPRAMPLTEQRENTRNSRCMAKGGKAVHNSHSQGTRNSEYVDERHRWRFEVNPELAGSLEEAGLKFVGKDESGKRMEILELPNHPFYVGVQFHPEFKSRPGRPSALFLGLVLAATAQLQGYLKHCQNGS